MRFGRCVLLVLAGFSWNFLVCGVSAFAAEGDRTPFVAPGKEGPSIETALEGVPATEIVQPSSFGTPNVLTMLAVIGMVALLPFAILLITSFAKIVIVLSLLRNALGVQQAPPNQVINGVALLMTIYVMFPTGVAMYDAGREYITKEAPKTLWSASTASYLLNVVDRVKAPLRDFLSRNMLFVHKKRFYELAKRSLPATYRETLRPNDFIVLIPSYILSQIKGAFEIGVLIYLPFFVIDLVTSNILLAMGMMMLSPLTIALPLKLLLIVMTDGWTLIVQGLVLTYR
ncbi:MAG: type III secretion system export apparatus subunit SctR [Simkaniaceae bacterium]|nr:type III secretion system export apparatus subunit SctR [Simkaniaceae bacterium]